MSILAKLIKITYLQFHILLVLAILTRNKKIIMRRANQKMTYLQTKAVVPQARPVLAVAAVLPVQVPLVRTKTAVRQALPHVKLSQIHVHMERNYTCQNLRINLQRK